MLPSSASDQADCGESQQCHARRLGNLNRYGVEEQESGIVTEIEGDRLGGSDRPVDGAEDLIRAGGRVGQVRERLTVDRCRKAAWRAAIRLERERNRVKLADDQASHVLGDPPRRTNRSEESGSIS